MKYNNLNELFNNINSLKVRVLSLNIDNRIIFKQNFFNQHFPEWQLSLIWEYFWDDKSYDELYLIFANKRLIKKEGDQLGRNKT